MSHCTDADLARIFRAESAKVIAVLMHQCRDLSLVEDALQDALVEACQQWPEHGLPRDCVAWLHTVAKRRLIDRLRSLRVRRDPASALLIEQHYCWRYREPEVYMSIPDDRLRLIFTCCHPSLAQSAQIALTLKVICGLSSKEIGRAFLISEDTLNRRLSRAKQKIAKAGIAYEVPEGEALNRRLPAVLAVIYLFFNESYTAYEGPSLSRTELGEEAIRLGRLLYELQPSAEAGGLLALMELHWARRAGRSSDEQDYIPLQAQDRRCWDREAIERASQFLYKTLARGEPGMYQIQAAISALHARAVSYESADWPQIAGLYAALYRYLPTPVVALNHCMACVPVSGAEKAWTQLESLASELPEYQPYFAARADLARRLHKTAEARIAYERAIRLSENEIEQQFLNERLASLATGAP